MTHISMGYHSCQTYKYIHILDVSQFQESEICEKCKDMLPRHLIINRLWARIFNEELAIKVISFGRGTLQSTIKKWEEDIR